MKNNRRDLIFSKKRMRRLAAMLAGILVLAVSGCSFKRTNTSDVTEISITEGTELSEQATEEDTGEVVAAEEKPFYYTNFLGMELRNSTVPGEFRCGGFVGFDDFAAYTKSDGIYIFRDGVETKVFDMETYLDQMICTDGYFLYLVDPDMSLVRINLGDPNYPTEKLASNLPGVDVIGAGNGFVHIMTEDVEDWEHLPGDVYRFWIDSKADLGSELIAEQAIGECGFGYSYVKGRSYDATPCKAIFYDINGNEIQTVEACQCAFFSAGTIWYSEWHQAAGQSLHYLDGTTPVFVEQWEQDEDWDPIMNPDYGYGIDGLILSHQQNCDCVYFDLRTHESVADYYLDVTESAFLGGLDAVGSHVFYSPSGVVYEDMGDHLEKIYEIKENEKIAFAAGSLLVLNKETEEVNAIPIE